MGAGNCPGWPGDAGCVKVDQKPLKNASIVLKWTVG